MIKFIENKSPRRSVSISTGDIPAGWAFRGVIGGCRHTFVKVGSKEDFTIYPLNGPRQDSVPKEFSPFVYGYSWTPGGTVDDYEPVDLTITVS